MKQTYIILIATFICITIALLVGLMILQPFSINMYLEKMQSESNQVPAYAYYGIVHMGEDRIELDSILEANNIQGTVEEVFLLDDNRVWFVYSDNSNKSLWTLASVSHNGSNLKVIFSKQFGENGGDTVYKCSNQLQDEFWEKKNGFLIDGQIVLTDHVQLVIYDLASDTINEMAKAKYNYPKSYWIVDVLDKNQIAIEHNNQKFILTKEDMFQNSKALAALQGFSESKIWNGKNPFEKFFHCVQTDGENLYIVCNIMNWFGVLHTLVFQYDIDCNEVTYCFTQETFDVVPYEFYVIPQLAK